MNDSEWADAERTNAWMLAVAEGETWLGRDAWLEMLELAVPDD